MIFLPDFAVPLHRSFYWSHAVVGTGSSAATNIRKVNLLIIKKENYVVRENIKIQKEQRM